MTDNISHRQWSKNAVIYELNIRQFTEEGTFKALMPHIPRLSKMGVGIIWLMPVHPVGEKNKKGSLGSFYAVKDYKGVNPEFGTLDELIALTKLAHELKMKVIIDWVANHSSWDNVWTHTNPDFYIKDKHGDFYSPNEWSDVIKLNYNNKEMRRAMIDALRYWIEVVGIDGFRCDVAGLVPTDFWDEARAELDTIKPVFMLAEDEENPDLLRYAFDMNYAWKAHHLMTRIAKEEAKADEFQDVFDWNNAHYHPSAYRMNFITNHDENSWNGTEFERLGEGVEAFAVLAWVIPGMPLIYSGQEAGLNRRLYFFDKDAILWNNIRYEDFYTRLNSIKHKNQALWNEEFGADLQMLSNNTPHQVLSFVRNHHNNTIVAVFNLSHHRVEVMVDTSKWQGDYSDLMKDNHECTLLNSGKFDLEPWEYRLLRRY